MALGMWKHGHVLVLEMQRPPNNFIDAEMVEALADALETSDVDAECRAIVVASAGKHFCAGADLARRLADGSTGHIYGAAARLVRTRKPIVAAIQGAAVGAGLGLAMLADFRVGCPEARLSANFTRQGYHPGFGLTFTLPRVIGAQQAAWLFYTGRRLAGEEASAIGLLDRLVPIDAVRSTALAMAEEVASSAPLAVQATRDTMRAGFADGFEAAIPTEMARQDLLRPTGDYAEGVRAMAERRSPVFRGR